MNYQSEGSEREVDALRKDGPEVAASFGQGSEGEVEPVGLAPAEVAAMGWDYKSFIVYRDDPGFSTIPLYSHETVQRLQWELDESQRKIRLLERVRDRKREREERLLALCRERSTEIDHLRDPENWEITADVRTLRELPQRAVDSLKIRYVGPPESESEGEMEPVHVFNTNHGVPVVLASEHRETVQRLQRQKDEARDRVEKMARLYRNERERRLELSTQIAHRADRLQRAGFYDQQRTGLGNFITREDIEGESDHE